jgi:single-stranded DNA-binding protein
MSWVITGTQKVNWDPSLITTALWLDAADNTTIFSDAGTTQAVAGTSTVQQWNDKSGNSRHVSQSTLANRPAFTANAQNGRNVLAFDGSNDTLSTAAALPAISDISLFAVVTGNSISANEERGYLSIDDESPSGFTNGYWMERSSYAGAPLAIYNVNSSFPINYGGSVTASFTAKIIGHVRAKNLSNTAFVDGTSYTGPTSGNLYAADIPSNRLYLGRSILTHSGSMCEIVICSAALDIVNRQKLEGYLAHKWGLTANLPVDHPYKVNPPAP